MAHMFFFLSQLSGMPHFRHSAQIAEGWGGDLTVPWRWFQGWSWSFKKYTLPGFRPLKIDPWNLGDSYWQNPSSLRGLRSVSFGVRVVTRCAAKKNNLEVRVPKNSTYRGERAPSFFSDIFCRFKCVLCIKKLLT